MSSTTWQETVTPDEDARFELYAQRLVTLQQKHGSAHRALHAKGHGAYEAKLTVADDVPAQARHGLFARAGAYEALVRYSNGASKPQADKVGDVRGIAVKVLGVDGDKIIGGARTQDFLAILSPATPFKGPEEFVGVVWAIRNPALALFRLFGVLGLKTFTMLPKMMASLKAPAASLASKKFYSALPIQCGPHAVRYAFTPVDVASGPLARTPDFYAEDLADRLRRDPVVYTLSLQFFIDEQRTPIEDASVDWDAPYVDVATLTLLKQDASSEVGKKLGARAEHLAFDPWHALVEHKPLGAMMRARKVTYFASTKTRKATPEPASIAALLA